MEDLERLTNELPLVTIVITNYNYEQYIAQAILSALNQTYRNIEVLVLDNCSTDGSKAIIERFADDNRVRIIFNERNIGRNPNYNLGVAEARGEFMTLLSADDYFVPNAIEDLIACLRRHPECDFVYANIFECNGEGEILGTAWLQGNVPVREYAGRNEFRALVSHYSYMWLPTCLTRVATMRAFGGFDGTFDVGSDLDLNLRITAAGVKGAFLNEPLVCVRFHGTNASWGTYMPSGTQLRELVGMLDRALTDPASLALVHGGERGPMRTIERHTTRRDLPGVAGAWSELAPAVAALSERLEASRRRLRAAGLGGALASVIVTMRNARRWSDIGETLASIRSQTHADVEIIVMYRGLTDPSGSVEHLPILEGVRFFEYTGDGGEAGMRAAGYELSNGSVVLFVNDMTRLEPHHIEDAIRALDRDDANVAVADAAVELEEPFAQFSSERRLLQRLFLNWIPDAMPSLAAICPCVPLEICSFRREALDEVNAFFEEVGDLAGWLLTVAHLHRAGVTATRRTSAVISYRLMFSDSPFGAFLSSLQSMIGNVYARVPVDPASAIGRERVAFVERLARYAQALRAQPVDPAVNINTLRGVYGGGLSETPKPGAQGAHA